MLSSASLFNSSVFVSVGIITLVISDLVCWIPLVILNIKHIWLNWYTNRASLVAQQWRICLQRRRYRFHPWVGKIPWRRKWLPTPVFLPRKSRDRGAWQATVHGSKESDTTEQLTTTQQSSILCFMWYKWNIILPKLLGLIFLTYKL